VALLITASYLAATDGRRVLVGRAWGAEGRAPYGKGKVVFTAAWRPAPVAYY